MKTGRAIGVVEVATGKVQIIGTDGVTRDAKFAELIFEGEQVISEDSSSLFQINYTALTESISYDGVFNILADGSAIAKVYDANSELSDAEKLALLEGGDDTASGEIGNKDGSGFVPSDMVASSSVLGFNRGENGELGFGITDFGQGAENGIDSAPPIIRSANSLIFDENDENPVIQLTVSDSSAVFFSLENGLDSSLFTIDANGVLRFITPPDYENPLDTNGDNEYVLNVRVTDALGNFTTQFISISINNLNDNAPIAEDSANAAIEDGVDVSGQLFGSDADGNEIEFVLVDGLSVGDEETDGGYEPVHDDDYSPYDFQSPGTVESQDVGSLIFNSDGSYTYSIGEAFQNLADGETATVTFTYRTVEVDNPLSAPDDAGPFASEIATVTILITGTNDRPEVRHTFVSTVETDGLQTFDGSLSLFRDVDTTDQHTFELRSTNQNTTAHGGHVVDGTANTVFNIGTDDNPVYAKVISDSDGLDNLSLESVVVDADGSFHVTGDFDALANGEVATVRFRYVAVDDSGVGINPEVGESDTSRSKMVELTIRGTNDQPVVEDIQTTVSEESLADTITEDYSFSGNVSESVSDDDISDSHSFVLDEGSAVVSITTSNPALLDILSDLGTPEMIEDFIEGITSGEIDFSYVDADSDNVMEEATVSLSSDLVEALIENGLLDISLDAVTGEYTISSPMFNFLGTNDKMSVSFNYRADDNNGFEGDLENEDSLSDAATVTLVVEGTNDSPVAEDITRTKWETQLKDNPDEDSIFKGHLGGASDEDLLDNLTLTYHGVDADDDSSIDVTTTSPLQADGLTSVVDASLTVVHLNENGKFSVTNSSFDSLAAGERATVTFSYYVDDGSLAVPTVDNLHESTRSDIQTVTLTIKGTNDRPEVEDVNVGMVLASANSEDGNLGVFAQSYSEVGEGSETFGHEQVSKVFDLGSEFAGKTVTISFDMFEEGTWDGDGTWNERNEDTQESFFVYVNGQEVLSQVMGLDGLDSNSDDAGELIVGESGRYGQLDLHHITVEVIVDENGQVILGLGSTLHEGLGNESYSIDNLEIVAGRTIYEAIDGLTVYDGQLSDVSDDDVNDTHTYQITSAINVDNPFIDAEVTLDETTGAFTMSGDFNSLAVGEIATVTFTYRADDGSRRPGFDESRYSQDQTVTIVVTGTNDAPVFEEQTDVQFVSETAGYDNVLIAYELDENGNPINPEIVVMNTNGEVFDTNTSIPFANIHFALIADGQTDTIENAILSFDNNGLVPILNIDGIASVKPVYFDINTFNADGKDHFDIAYNGEDSYTVNIEDLNLGDNDRQDLVVNVFDGSGGMVTELDDTNPNENIAILSTTGTIGFSDVDLMDTHTVSYTLNDDNYLGVFTPSLELDSTGNGVGEVKWTFEVNDADVDHLAEGEVLTQVYTIEISDGNGGVDTQDVTVLIKGTNDGPIAVDDTITKVADANFVHQGDGNAWDYANISVSPHGRLTENHNNDLGIKTSWLDSSQIDGFGPDETIRFDFDNALNSVMISLSNFDSHSLLHDQAQWTLYNGSVVVESGTYQLSGHDTASNVSFEVSGDDVFDRVEITAPNGYSDFRVSAIDGYGFDVREFTINQDMILENDTDIDGDSLSIANVSGATKGTVSLDADGNVVYTPTDTNAVYGDEDSYDTFTYTITDGIAESAEATVTINLTTGQVQPGDVLSSDINVGEVLIGSDTDDVLVVSGTLNLSHISEVEAIHLTGDSRVVGSSDLGEVDVHDIISASDSNELLITTDGVGVSEVDLSSNLVVAVDQSNVESGFTAYTDSTEMVLITIEDVIDVV